MKKRLGVLLISLLFLAGCGIVSVQPTDTPKPDPTEAAILTPETEPASALTQEDRSVFIQALLREAALDQNLAKEEEYGTGKFKSLSHNAIGTTAMWFFYAVREQLENLEDIDFAVFWDPKADPAQLQSFLDEIKSFRSKEYPVTWANVSYDEVSVYEVEGAEGEIVTVQYWGSIGLFYPNVSQIRFVNMRINHELTFVCRDKCWYISAIKDLGP